MTDTADTEQGSEKRFYPPKPDHRKMGMGPLDVLKIANKDMLAMFPGEAYNYLMGKYRVGLVNVFTINCLKTARTVLVDEHDDYPKSRYMMRMLFPLIRDAVFSSSGEKWRTQRRRLKPAFNHIHLKRAYPHMQEAVDRLTGRIDAAIAAGKPVDMERELSFVTADVIFRVMFSITLDGEDARVIFENFQKYQRFLENFGLRDIFEFPNWFPKFKNENAGLAGEAADALRDVSDKLVRARLALAQEDRPDDMLTDILVEYKADFGDDIPVDDLVDQLSFFFLAGHETLASATTWGLYLLSETPEYAEKVRAEVADVFGGGKIGFDKIRLLKWIPAVFKETLRLYPSVPYFTREATKPATLRKHQIKPGDQLSIAPFFMQRHKRYWHDPDAFLPERFLPGQEEEGTKNAYMPFSEGPRICPGAAFSHLEAALIFATLLRRYDFKVAEGHIVEPLGRFTLRPKHGMVMEARAL